MRHCLKIKLTVSVIFGREAFTHLVLFLPPDPFSLFLFFFIFCWATCYLSFMFERIFISLWSASLVFTNCSLIILLFIILLYTHILLFQIHILHFFFFTFLYILIYFYLKSLLMLHFHLVSWSFSFFRTCLL